MPSTKLSKRAEC